MHVNSPPTPRAHRPRRGLAHTSLTAALLLSTTLATHARADEHAAAAHLSANMARVGLSFTNNKGELKARPTAVRGIYEVIDRNGKFLTYTNESGTLSGDSRMFHVLDAGSATKQRPLTAQELQDLRAELMANIDYDKLIKVVYGNGGGRKLLMFAAVDCGYCRKLEETLLKNARTLNTTFYVLPGSLQNLNQGGLQAMQTVTNIWCAPNNGDAWKNFWTKRVVPPERSCRLTPATAEFEYDQIKAILSGAGSNLTGVPRVLNEEGMNVSYTYDLNAASAAAAFGPDARMPPSATKAAYWIPSESEAFAQQQALSAQAPVPQQAGQKTGKINTKDLLKKLFK